MPPKCYPELPLTTYPRRYDGEIILTNLPSDHTGCLLCSERRSVMLLFFQRSSRDSLSCGVIQTVCPMYSLLQFRAVKLAGLVKCLSVTNGLPTATFVHVHVYSLYTSISFIELCVCVMVNRSPRSFVK